MRYKIFGMLVIMIFLLTMSLYGQDVVVKMKPYDGMAETFLNAQIVADTVASGGLLATHVYELDRDQYYLANAILTIPRGKTLRIRAAEGTGKKPVVFLWETGTGANPTRPAGNFVVLNGSTLHLQNICVVGYYEPEPERIGGVQGGLINTTAVGSSIYLDGVVLSNINGQHVRTGQNSKVVKITNSIFANMGALSTSNLGAGKGIDLREAAIDSFIVLNTTFVNFQDRAIRHYNFANPTTGTGEIKYGRIEHNTFINGMGFHGLLSLGNVGPEIIISNNLFVDAFALGEDSTDVTRAAEWANTGEKYSNGNNKITWIFTAPNATTQWTVENNYYTISDSGLAFLNDYKFGVASPLSAHIQERLGAGAANAFKEVDLSLANTPKLMTNMMRWYERPNPNGANKLKDQTYFVLERDDYDRRAIEYYRDEFNASYSTASAAYTGGEGGFPAGDLNWFPEKKKDWEKGYVPVPIVVDAAKDAFYEALTGPNDGYLQIKSYAFNDNGIPAGDDDLSAKVWTAWDEKWLYLYEEVMDDTLSGNATNVYEEDEIELKFDPQPTDSVKNSVWDTRLTALGKETADVVAEDNLGNIADDKKKWARKVIPGGYALEMAIDWSVVVKETETITPAVGTIFGLAINQHDNDGKKKRQASIQWGAVMKDAAWNTPKYHGTVQLLAGNKLQFIAKNNMTGKTNPIPYDGTPFYLSIDAKKDPFFTGLKNPDEGYIQVRHFAFCPEIGKPTDDKDQSAKIWSAWDADWFYLYAEVTDDKVLISNTSDAWKNDCIELKIDGQPTDSTETSISYETRLTALGPNTAVPAEKADDMSNIAAADKKFARAKTATGYVLEMAIKLNKMGGTQAIDAAVDKVFGLAIHIVDNDDSDRSASIAWAAKCTDFVWSTPKYHGTVKFAASNQVQFIAKNNMTGKVNPIPYDGSNPLAVDKEKMVAYEFNLAQNYPNPFNPSTKINYTLANDENVTLRIFNMNGQEVALLVNNQKQAAGKYNVSWNGMDHSGKLVSTGLYFYQLQTNSSMVTKKMVFVK